MTDKLNISLAQINPKVGDVAGNLALIRETRVKARDSDLIVFPELMISGYPPEDLVLKPAFQEACRQALDDLAADSGFGEEGPALLVGAPWVEDGRLLNGLFLIEGGRIAASRFKRDLPNYGVFDEKRVFQSGPAQGPVPFRGLQLGLQICEDFWFPQATCDLARAGADLLIVPNGSPFEHDKPDQRLKMAGERQGESGLPVIYLNIVGGQDELVFDGGSFVLDRGGVIKCRLPSFAEKIVPTNWRKSAGGWSCAKTEVAPQPDRLEAIYRALMLGLKDYVEKNGFPGILLGLSGGIDSALTAAVAADALGPERVRAVMMPSPYTSADSLEDAATVAEMLGLVYDSVPIEPAMHAFETMLRDLFAGHPKNTAEENIQSRIRGVILMALSNKLGHMLLTTGNKSEMSVGYATLYGDMCGGYSVLKDVYKMMVFELSRWRNASKPMGALGPKGRVMPERVITKAPSAELKPNQTDQDTLPPYSVLDGILDCLVEHEMGVEEVVAKGFEQATVLKVWRMLDIAEYKRRQAPPGVKITSRAFGRDRRYPITNGFKPR
jgi:NAD+ synthase